jgi:hypothetical protein
MALFSLKQRYRRFRTRCKANKLEKTLLKLSSPYHLSSVDYSEAYEHHMARDIKGLKAWGYIIGMGRNCWHERLL